MKFIRQVEFFLGIFSVLLSLTILVVTMLASCTGSRQLRSGGQQLSHLVHFQKLNHRYYQVDTALPLGP